MNKEIKEAIERLETQTKDIESIRTFLSVTKIGNEEALAKLREISEQQCKTCGDTKVVPVECQACAIGIQHHASECGGEKPCPDCQQPPAGEFTKKMRKYYTNDPPKDKFEEALDRLDRSEAENCKVNDDLSSAILEYNILEAKLKNAEASKADLLELCKKLLTCLRAAKAYPQTMNLWNEEIREAEAAIAKAKKENGGGECLKNSVSQI